MFATTSGSGFAQQRCDVVDALARDVADFIAGAQAEGMLDDRDRQLRIAERLRLGTPEPGETR